MEILRGFDFSNPSFEYCSHIRCRRLSVTWEQQSIHMPHATKNRFILSATFHLWQSQYYHFAFLTSPWHYRTHLWFLLWDARSDSLPFLLIWMLTLWGTMWCGLRLSMRGESFFLSPKIYLEAINICFEIGLCQFMGWVLMFTRQTTSTQLQRDGI